MVRQEDYSVRDDGVKLVRTFSDNGKKIRKIGTDQLYDEAVDVISLCFAYDETNEDVSYEDVDTKNMDAEDMRTALAMLGVE